jgi:hemolysin activation/secretion protein
MVTTLMPPGQGGTVSITFFPQHDLPSASRVAKVPTLKWFSPHSIVKAFLYGLLSLPVCCLPALGATDTPGAARGEELPPQKTADQPVEPEPTFEIGSFRVEGNTLFSSERLTLLLDDLTGADRTAGDVERGRDLLEKFYHDQGYPTVLVNIPEQSAESGTIRLQVIESRVAHTKVTGNRFYSSERILERLPSLSPGAILYVPAVQSEVTRLNRTADLKVSPAMAPGKELGSVEVELKAEDQSPLHGFLELNNRNSANTSLLRLNAGVHYDNLWNREHSVSLQVQSSPEKPSEVRVFSGSYLMPAPWNHDNSLVLYGVLSDSNTAFGEGFHTVGKGSIVGLRYSMALPERPGCQQSAVIGFDYKKFDESTGLDQTPGGDVKTPIEYLPFSFAYSGSLSDPGGTTLFNAGLSLSFRGAVAHQGSFENKRSFSRGNYVAATAGVERRQKLPGDFGFLIKLDGQFADQPLISNEQYSAGGMESVRGYRESALAGDNALHAVTELSAPDLAGRFGWGERFKIVPYLFYDCAALFVKDALAGQESAMNLQGTGFGVRGVLFRDLEFELDAAIALTDTTNVRSGDSLIYFKIKYQF